jgi:hypothetical protein
MTPRIEGQFHSFREWVRDSTALLGGHLVPAVCIDAKGRRCHINADFVRARDEGTFPVYFFWDCVPTPDPLGDALNSGDGTYRP